MSKGDKGTEVVTKPEDKKRNYVKEILGRSCGISRSKGRRSNK